MTEFLIAIENQIKNMIKSGLEGYFTVEVRPGNTLSVADAEIGFTTPIQRESKWAVFSLKDYNIEEEDNG